MRGATARSRHGAASETNVMLHNSFLEDPVSELKTSAQTDLAGLDRHVGYMLRRAQLAVFGDFIACQRGAVTRPGQFSILAVIDGNPGLSQSRVCAALGIKRANLVAVIDELETLGLVRRDASAKDRRDSAHCAARSTVKKSMRRALRNCSAPPAGDPCSNSSPNSVRYIPSRGLLDEPQSRQPRRGRRRRGHQRQ